MFCVSHSPSNSATSSLRGQILVSECPSEPSNGGGNPRSDGPPPSPPLSPPAAGTADEESPSPPLPPPAAGAADEEFGGRPVKRARPEPGTGGDGEAVADPAAGDGRDRLSELPDAVLLSVLSHLPLRDAGRTAVLSSRWRGLFDQSLLDFNACQPFPPEEGRGCGWVIRAITDILAARPGIRIRSFRFVMYGWGFYGRIDVVHGWFRTLAQRGLRELDVDMFYATPMPTLPGSLFGLASLETLKVYYCRFPYQRGTPAPAPGFPVLKILHLSNVDMSQDALHAILSHSPSLECVKLKNIIGLNKICLRSKSLTRLYGDFGDLKELLVEDAPNLEELVGIGLPSGNVKMKIVSAPKLMVLGYVGISVRPLVLHDTVFDGGITQLRTLMCSVKTLAIQVPYSEKGYTVFVTQLLKCFPCLEVLRVEPDKRSSGRHVDVEEWGIANSIQCIEHSINRVVFEYFGGEACQWGFLTFLLGMARALKLVEVYCCSCKDRASVQIEQIDPNCRASPDAKVQFFRICKPASDLYLCHCCTQRCQMKTGLLI